MKYLRENTVRFSSKRSIALLRVIFCFTPVFGVGFVCNANEEWLMSWTMVMVRTPRAIRAGVDISAWVMVDLQLDGHLEKDCPFRARSILRKGMSPPGTDERMRRNGL